MGRAQVGTLQYMAPELLNQQRYDERVDVYAFGIVLWEIASKKEPFRGCRSDDRPPQTGDIIAPSCFRAAPAPAPQAQPLTQLPRGRRGRSPAQIVRDVDKGERPPLKDVQPGMGPDYVLLMQACWHQSPKERPAFAAVQSKLETLLRRGSRLDRGPIC